MYNIKLVEKKEQKRGKGAKKNVLKRDVTFDDQKVYLSTNSSFRREQL